MADITWRRRVGALGLGALGAALITFGLGAPAAAAIETHPCLPGERDVVGAVDFVGAGRVYEVWFCGASGSTPAPSLPFGSASAGHPCEPGETDGTHKVRGHIEDYGDVIIWFCSDADGGPPPPEEPEPEPAPPARDYLRPVVKGHDPLVADGPALRFEPVGPVRVHDTRMTGTALAAGVVVTVDVGSVVGPSARAVAVNITAAGPTAAGYLTAWRCDAPQPATSAVNFVTGETASSNAIVQLDADQRFCVVTSAPTHLVVDVNAAYSEDGRFGYRALNPARVFDSRPAAVAAGSITRVTIGGLPRAASGVFLNLTAVAPTHGGYLTVWPCAAPQPEASHLNHPAGVEALANAIQVPLDATSELCVYNSATTGFLIDLSGVFDDDPASLPYQPVRPVRVLDTRDGTGGFYGAVRSGSLMFITMLHPQSVVGTVTAVDPLDSGFLTIWDRVNYSPRPDVSSLNVGDRTIANMFVSKFTDGYLWVGAGPTMDAFVVLDISGYF